EAQAFDSLRSLRVNSMESKNPVEVHKRHSTGSLDFAALRSGMTLFLLLLFFWSLFLSTRSGRSSLALFLFLGDDFRSGGRRFRFGHRRLFFNHWREHGKCSEIGRHLWRYPGGKLDVADVNGITNVQIRNIDRDPIRQIARQTFDRQHAQALLKQSAKSFDAHRYTDRFEGNFGLNHLVHGDGVKVHMTNFTTDRRVLHLMHERRAT